MDHGHHNHGDMGSDQPMCSMNMLFTWDTTNLCIVFSSWRITGPISLLFSLLAVMALTAGYEAVREASRAYENRLSARIDSMTREYHPNRAGIKQEIGGLPSLPAIAANTADESSPLWRAGSEQEAERKKGKTVKAALYGIQVFYSFFIMLLFMTYNGWIMLAVGLGAFFGYLMFGGGSVEKSAACH